MNWIYAVYNKKNNKYYIGQTEDIAHRLLQHNSQEFKGSYTSRFDGEWQLIYKEQCINRTEALKREKQLKSYQGRQFIKKYIPL